MTGQDSTADVAVIDIDRLAPHQQVTAPQPACRGIDLEVFFGPADSPAGRNPHAWERRALAVCADCPVVKACLAEALEYPAAEQYGVVGGRTAEQRRAVLRASRRGRGQAQRLRKKGQDVSSPLNAGRRPMRSSALAATPPAGGTHRGSRPARA
ncbi:MAG: WhiB family transcriptional regulator [Pseudonocardiaceae bacterium]